MLNDVYEKEKKVELLNNKGFTLVELLVAIVILAMVMMPISRLFITAGGINSKARREQQANITANSVLESAKAFPLTEFYNQCKANNASSFTLIASKDNSQFSSAVFTQYDNTNTATLATSFAESNQTYAYRINGLLQNKSLYDAIVIFEKVPFKNVKIDNTNYISETDVSGIFSDNKLEGVYYKQYAIRVYVYEHGADVSSEAFSKTSKGNALVMLTGSKLDSAK